MSDLPFSLRCDATISGHRCRLPLSHQGTHVVSLPEDTTLFTQAELDERVALFAQRAAEAIDHCRDLIGRIMHESWSRTKLEQGFHKLDARAPCQKCHADLVDWSELPQAQKDINLHAFRDVIPVLQAKVLALIPNPNAIAGHDAALRVMHMHIEREQWLGERAAKLEAESARLREQIANIGKCSVCGAWTNDPAKPIPHISGCNELKSQIAGARLEEAKWWADEMVDYDNPGAEQSAKQRIAELRKAAPAEGQK